MKPLSVLLLGPPEIRFNQELVVIQRRYPRALLFYLAWRGGMVGRDELLTLFWEDEPDSVARLRLRETLNKLKSSLPMPSLVSEGDLVGLDTNSIYIDYLEFRNQLHEIGELPWRVPPTEPLPEYLYQALVHLMRLWRSSHFLSGADFPSTPAIDDWLMRTVQQNEHTYSRVLERLSEHDVLVGDLEPALHKTRLALETEDLNDELHERVLRLLITLNRRQEAETHFRYYEKRLMAELGNSSHRLAALREILSSDTGGQTQPKPDWNVKIALRSPFIHREEPMKRLRKAYHKGGAVFIYGEAGLGKTRLVSEFAAQIKPRPRTLLGRGRPNEAQLPFQPFADLLRSQIRPEEWGALAPTWIRQLVPLLPELETPFLPPTPAPGNGLLFEAFRQLMLQLYQNQRLLLFMDDLQWVDPDSLDLLAYLLERAPFNHQSLLIAALRSEEVMPALKAKIQVIASSSQVESISLERLSAEDVSLLVQSVLGRAPKFEFIQHCTRKTGGNPLFLLECLSSMLQTDPTQNPEYVESLPLAPSLHSLARDRLNKLSPLALAALQAAAVLGLEFEPQRVGQMIQVEPAELISILQELEEKNLIEVVPGSPTQPCYRFIHGLLREALLDDQTAFALHELRQKAA